MKASLIPQPVTPTTVTAAGAVMKALFDADTILAANTDDTPAALAVAANTVLCRAGGNIEALAVAASTVLGRGASGDLTDLTAANLLSLLRLVCIWQEPHEYGGTVGRCSVRRASHLVRNCRL